MITLADYEELFYNDEILTVGQVLSEISYFIKPTLPIEMKKNTIGIYYIVLSDRFIHSQVGVPLFILFKKEHYKSIAQDLVYRLAREKYLKD